MKRLQDLKPGDTVVVVDTNFGAKTVVVSKIGKKYIHAGINQFDKDTGVVQDAYGHSTLYTQDQYDQQRTVARASKELRKLGVMFDWGVKDEIKLAVYAACKPLLGT